MKLKLEQMELTHISQVLVIELESFTTPWNAGDFTSELTKNDFASYVVCLRDGQDEQEEQGVAEKNEKQAVVGYAGMWQIIDEIHITNVAVKKEYRGKRIAEALLLRLLLLGKINKAERATLEVRPSNLAALQLYERLGFKSVGRRPKYYQDNGEDAIIMWKNIGGVE